jgi:hypothetical protein
MSKRSGNTYNCPSKPALAEISLLDTAKAWTLYHPHSCLSMQMRKEAFWTLTAIIESILPREFSCYVCFLLVLLEYTQVFMPKSYTHLTELGVDLLSRFVPGSPHVKQHKHRIGMATYILSNQSR